MTNTKPVIPRAPGVMIHGVIGRDDTDTGKGRRYIRPSDNLVLDSVTNVLDATGDQSFIKRWYSKLAGQVVAQHLDEICALTAADLPEETLKAFQKANDRIPDSEEALELARTSFVQARLKFLSEVKADIGSHQHHVLEALVLDEPIPEVPEHLVDIEVDDTAVDHDAISDGLLRFFADFPDAVVIMAEATVADPELGTAGTLDLIVEFPRGITIEGVTYFRLLIDLKAGKWLKHDMKAQLAAYRYSKEIWIDPFGNTEPMLEVDGAAVLHLRRDYAAGYKVILVDAGPDEYEWFVTRVGQFKKSRAESKLIGKVVYPPLEDGSQPLPLVEDLEELGRAKSVLKTSGFTTLWELASFTEDEIMAIKGIGPKSIESCKATLTEHGLAFRTGETTDAVA